MLRLIVALVALSATGALAQQDDLRVWSSFVYLRAGERTPNVLTDFAPTLTSLGAQQLYSAGEYFREQYLQEGSASRIEELDNETPRTDQVYTLAIDSQFTAASAQSFLLGMWPPTTTSSENVTADTQGIPNQLVNGTILETPQGIHLPRISTAGSQDIDSVYVGGDLACPGFSRAANAAFSSEPVTSLIAESQSTYTDLSSLLDPVLNRTLQTFAYAKTIYDYLSYQNNYSPSTAPSLSPSLLTNLRLLTDNQQSLFYSNLSTPSPYSRAPLWATRGSISTLPGAGLATRISTHFYSLIFAPAASTRLTVLVGDHGPPLSLLALLNLSQRLPGLPLPGSALVFELVSSASAATNLTATGLPPPSALSIRFRFRNGTGITGTTEFPGTGGDMTTLSLFNRSSEDVNIPYNDFLAALGEVSLSGPGDWCYQCAATTLFCAAWNTSNAFDGNGQRSGVQRAADRDMSPVVAGVIGAVVALAVAGLIALVLFFVVGLGFKRKEPMWAGSRRRKSEMGGFKGRMKLGSDMDVSTQGMGDKGGAVVGASVVEPKAQTPQDGHARVGSWEMKDGSQGAIGGDATKPWAQKHMRVDSSGTLVERDMGHMGLDGATMGWGSVSVHQGEPGRAASVQRSTVASPVVTIPETATSEADRPESWAEEVMGAVDDADRRVSEDSGHVDPFQDPPTTPRPGTAK